MARTNINIFFTVFRMKTTRNWQKIYTEDGKILVEKSKLMSKTILKNIRCIILINLLLFLAADLEKCIIGILTGQFKDC